MPGLLVSTLNLVGLPTGTPDAVVAAMAGITRRVMADEAFRTELVGIGVEPVVADAAESARVFRAEIERWLPVIRASGAAAG